MHVRHNLKIDRELLEEAQRILGVKTYRETVDIALRRAVEMPTWPMERLMSQRYKSPKRE
ncbi:type II toxin-antitoxin system VapB family antitoxin [Sphingomonas sp. GB1N7]|uniref:type II toxin-antitoxin system VapB family antitoxin n=1 Tax=Parasphingomonas caseinilytica TaxID=3096158 RepID=UPI003FA7924F